jgi:sugar phosphate permease
MKLSTTFYPGWWVHAGLFFCAAVIVGSSAYTFGLFVVPVTEELAISRGTMNNGYIAMLLGTALISPFVGRLLDRFSARIVILSGAITYAAGLVCVSLVESPLVMLIIMLIPVAYGYAACGTLAVNTVIVRWFKRRRGAALGIMAVSTSAGGFVFAPLTAMLIANLGWRTALLINAVIAVIAVFLMTVLIIRNVPRGTELGYEEEFNAADKEQRTEASKNGIEKGSKNASKSDQIWTYAELLRNRSFWLLTLAIGLMLGSDQAMITAKVPYFMDIGIDMQSAAFIVSCMTASAICGKLLVGYLADKVDLRYVFSGVALCHVALQLVYIAAPGYWTLLIFSTLFGIAIGGVFPVWSTMLAWTFGTKNYGTVMGAMTIATKGMAVVAVRFIGEVHDETGSYVPGFAAFSVAVIISMLLVAMLKPQQREAKAEPVLAH